MKYYVPSFTTVCKSYAMVLLILLGILALTSCTVDAKVTSKPTDDRWTMDSTRIGECMFYSGFANRHWVRVLQCPVSVRAYNIP